MLCLCNVELKRPFDTGHFVLLLLSKKVARACVVLTSPHLTSLRLKCHSEFTVFLPKLPAHLWPACQNQTHLQHPRVLPQNACDFVPTLVSNSVLDSRSTRTTLMFPKSNHAHLLWLDHLLLVYLRAVAKCTVSFHNLRF
jgi:hypothetical protein